MLAAVGMRFPLKVAHQQMIKMESSSKHQKEPEDDEFKWSTEATKLMLYLYCAQKDDFHDPKKKKKDCWQVLSEEMESYGYKGASADKLDKKFRNMKKSYIKIRIRTETTGKHHTQWEHYDQMDEIFDNKIPESTIQMLKEPEPEPEPEPEVPTMSWHTEHLTNSDETLLTPMSRDPLSVKKRKAENMVERRTELKKFKELELEKIAEIKAMREAIEHSNELQEERIRLQDERNEILRSLVDVLNSRDKN